MYNNAKLPISVAAESLYSNYYAYLRDARQKIASCQLACTTWSRRYEDEEEEEEKCYEDEEVHGDDTDSENATYNDYYEDNDSSFGLFDSPDKDNDEHSRRSKF